jgi:hypothetical protein
MSRLLTMTFTTAAFDRSSSILRAVGATIE